MMTKTHKTAATLIALGMMGSFVLSSPASAGGWDHHWNAPLAGGIAGGLLLGAIMSNANAAPVMVEDGPVVECHRVHAPVYNEYGEFVGYRRTRVCDQ